MAIIIEDGTGSGSKASVTNNKLDTHSVTESQRMYNIKNGTDWIVSTSKISLTSANESCVFYLKNNYLDKSIYLTDLHFNLGFSKAATGTNNPIGQVQVRGYLNPTSTTANVACALNVSNTNYVLLPSVTAYQGVEGSAITGGTLFITSIRQHGSNYMIGDDTPYLIIGPTNSLAFLITPPTGTSTGTSAMDLSIISSIFTISA